jgi:hypothetical protein
VNLESILRDISPESLANMADALSDRSATLLASGDPAARPWGRLYGYLSVEMDCAALERRTGIRV